MRSGLLELLGRGLRGQAIAHYVNMPALAVVDDIEVIHRLRRTVDPREYLVLHSPAAFERRPPEPMKVGGQKVEGMLFTPKNMRHGLGLLYERQGQAAEQSEQTLRSLEQSVQEATARRTETMADLQTTAREILSREGGDQRRVELKPIIDQILTSQFEYLEHFIREGIQNADGSSEDKANNRIDIYLDRATRTVRIEDQGRGMTRRVMDHSFFNLYASLNEALEHAAGKFGIGAISLFGLDHEYVKVDSNPTSGEGGRTVITSDLERPGNLVDNVVIGDYEPSQRDRHGTTIEIKLSEDSAVDFDRIKEIIEGDCAYIETPLYVHEDGRETQMNKELRHTQAQGVTFDEDNVKGYIELMSGQGELHLLDHRIRLNTIPVDGYCGVVDCAGLETTFSRDSVSDDPVLSNVLNYVGTRAAQLRGTDDAATNLLSLEARLKHYRDFVRRNLFTESGAVNEDFVLTNRTELEHGSEFIQGDDEPSSRILEKLGRVAAFPFEIMSYLKSEYKHRVRGEERKWSSLREAIGGFDLEGISGVCTGYLGGCGLAVAEIAVLEALHEFTPLTYTDLKPFEYGIGGTMGAVVLGAAEAFGPPVYRRARDIAAKALINRYNNKLHGSYLLPSDTGAITREIGGSHWGRAALTTGALGLALLGTGYGITSLLPTESGHQPTIQEEPSQRATAAPQETARESQSQPSSEEGSNIPLYVLLGGAAAAAGGMHLRRRRRLRPYDRSPTAEERAFLSDVQSELQKLPQVPNVYFGKNLGENDPAFYLGKRRVVLNPERTDILPRIVSLGYASEILKDVGASRRIAEVGLRAGGGQ